MFDILNVRQLLAINNCFLILETSQIRPLKLRPSEQMTSLTCEMYPKGFNYLCLLIWKKKLITDIQWSLPLMYIYNNYRIDDSF